MPSVMASLSAGLIILFLACGDAFSDERKDYGLCLDCHAGIEKIGVMHDFPCTSCHIRAELRGGAISSHDKIVRNPSDPSLVRDFCLPCHRREIDALERSIHATVAGIINQTRFLWGAQKAVYPYEYGLSGTLKMLPDPSGSEAQPYSPERLVDDFLRRRCLRCHINTMGEQAAGLYRATGCASCHVLYANDGLYAGDDLAVKKDKTGYPITHRFTSKIPVIQCLHCHNHNHVGTDYVGLFEKDYHKSYRVPSAEGTKSPLIYGLQYHQLSKDVHYDRGLWCTDCHGKEDVMADAAKKSCTSCHRPAEESSGESTEDFVTKAGQRLRASAFSRMSAAHSVDSHQRVRCSACHAQWSFQDYGLSVIREDIVDAYKWRDISIQGEPAAQRIIEENSENPLMIYPVSRDWVSGEIRAGLWSSGWRFRRWEPMPIGVDRDGKYAVLRPMYQYILSFVGGNGYVILDGVVPTRGDGSSAGWAFLPYTPHTVSPFGRNCDSCHENRIAAGQGIYDGEGLDTSLTMPSPPVNGAGRLLDPEERKKLMEPSMSYLRKRLKALAGEPYTPVAPLK